MSTQDEPDVSDLYDTIDPYANTRQCVPVTSPRLHMFALEDGGMILSECDELMAAQQNGEWIECMDPVEVEQ